ncbi:MAG: riboflavin synthase [Cyclobacteriaceae bacterium]|nr:riboflavin synthase [Cyclobacteriaceae bacterium HetDA_MAG_MS6]
MFTGIIESLGKVKQVIAEGSNVHFEVASPISTELKVDQSVAHSGVCLTVTKTEGDTHWVTAVDETLNRSSLKNWGEGSIINLERCMRADGRFDGHIVQGHVDMTGIVKEVKQLDGSWEFGFSFGKTDEVLVDKGSVCVNGVSLTCFDTADHYFKVAIIPYTYEHTNFHQLAEGDIVNLEFDILGKYARKLLQKQ